MLYIVAAGQSEQCRRKACARKQLMTNRDGSTMITNYDYSIYLKYRRETEYELFLIFFVSPLLVFVIQQQ